MSSLALIWAQSTSGVIGRACGIPWRLPEDQAHFKKLTLGHRVVMGRLTWESLPASVRPLPGRTECDVAVGSAARTSQWMAWAVSSVTLWRRPRR